MFWSRSDIRCFGRGATFGVLVAERPPKVAVGFNPRLPIAQTDFVAERRLNHRHAIGRQLDASDRPTIQSSLRDERVARHPNPWVETHGYHRMSLRDRNAFGRTLSRTTAFSPDGRRLAASFWEHGASAGVQIINLASGVVEKRLTFPGRVHELTFTDDSRHLITGNANATIYVVRLEPAPTK